MLYSFRSGVRNLLFRFREGIWIKYLGSLLRKWGRRWPKADQKKYYIIATGGIVTIIILTAVIVLLSYIANFLAIWALLLIFLFVGVNLAWLAPPPSRASLRICFVLLCLYLLLELVWPRYALLRLPGGLPGLSPNRICQGLMLVTWLYLVLKGNNYRQLLVNRVNNHRTLFMAAAVLLSLKFFSVFISPQFFNSLKGFADDFLSIYMIFMVSITIVEDLRDVKRLLLVLLIGIGIVSILGVVESIIQHNLFVDLLEIDSNYMQQAMEEKIRAGAYRIQSTFSHPLTFSEFIVVSTPIVLAVLLAEHSSLFKSGLLIMLLGIMGYCVFESGSRSGVGGFLLSIGGYVVLISFRQIKITKNAIRAGFYFLVLITAAVLLVTALYAISDLLIGKTTREINSGLVRIEMWRHGIQLALEQPFLGYGERMAASTLGFKSGTQFTIDSYYLSILLDSGFFSLLLYIYLFAYLCWTAVKFGLRDEKSGSIVLSLGVMVFSFLVMKSILSLTDNHGIFMALFSFILILSQKPYSAVKFTQATRVLDLRGKVNFNTYRCFN
jgi:hypothetical protein